MEKGELFGRYTHKAPVCRQAKLNLFALENLAQHIVGASCAVCGKSGVEFWKTYFHNRLFQSVRLARGLCALCSEVACFFVELKTNVKILQDTLFFFGEHLDECLLRFLSVGRNRHALAVRQVDGKERVDWNPLDFVQNSVFGKKFAQRPRILLRTHR